MKPTYEELEAKVKQLAAESAGMDAFVDEMLSTAWSGGSADGAEIQEMALKYGLIRREVYSQDEHETLVDDPGNFEDGDAVYFRVETPATDTYLSQLRNEARAEIAVMMDGHAARYDALARQATDFGVDNRYRFTAAMFRGVAKELREGKSSPQSTTIEYPKNSSPSNGWAIDPGFLSRVQERAAAVYGYEPGLEETEAVLLVAMDYLHEGKAGEVVSD